MNFDELIYPIIGLSVFCVLISLEKKNKIDFDKIKRRERPSVSKKPKKRNFKEVF